MLHRDTPPLPFFSLLSSHTPYPVIISASSNDGASVRLSGVIGADADGVDVPALVRLDPQLPDDLVDIVHLPPMEAHDGAIQGSVVLAQITAS